jgi:methyl-accepting chemotaxis protein
MTFATTIKAKFSWLAMVILLLILGMIIAGMSGISRIERQGRVSFTAEGLTASLRQLLQGLAETVVIPDTPETIDTARAGIASFDAGLVQLRELNDEPELLAILDEQILPIWGKTKSDAQGLLAIKRLSPDDVETMIAFGMLLSKSEKLLAASQQFIELSSVATAREVAATKRLLGYMATMVITVSALFFFLFYRSLVNPLRALSASARRVSEGNLNQQIDTSRHDELGEVARSFAVMISGLAKTIHKYSEINRSIAEAVRSASEVTGEINQAVRVQKNGVEQSVSAIDELYRSYGSVGENVDALNAASVASADAIKTLSASLQGVMRDTQSFYQQAERTVGDVREMIVSSSAIAEGIDGLKRFSAESSQMIGVIEHSLQSTRNNAEEAMHLAQKVRSESMEMGVASVRSALQGMERLEGNVLALTGTVNRLGRKSEEIGNIVTVIDEITTQTKLLALNAAIISAQAGEQGKGFAVVAEEIRALADRTSLSTREIGEVVASVQQETLASVEWAKEGEEAVRTGKELVARVSDNLETINQSAALSAVKAAEILSSAAAEATEVMTMAHAVDELSTQVASIAEEVRTHQRGNSQIQKALEDFMTTAAQIKAATTDQQRAGQSITTAAEQIANLSRQIGTTIAEQKASTDHIIGVIHTMNDSAGRLLATTQRLSSNIQPLSDKADSLTVELRWFQLDDAERHSAGINQQSGEYPKDLGSAARQTAPPAPESAGR